MTTYEKLMAEAKAEFEKMMAEGKKAKLKEVLDAAGLRDKA